MRHHHAERRSAWRSTTSKQMWKSPNGTIRAMLDGTVFRAPIMVKGIEPYVNNWKKPITIARHAYGDVYKNAEMRDSRPGQGGAGVHRRGRHRDAGDSSTTSTAPAWSRACTTWTSSIDSFARSCFEYALDTKQDLWFATKDTISKKYDHRFKDIFARRSTRPSTRSTSRRPGITYFYTLIDDAVARVMQGRGRLHLGLQELRRRRDERHGRPPPSARLAMMTVGAGLAPTATTSTRPPTAPCSATTTSI